MAEVKNYTQEPKTEAPEPKQVEPKRARKPKVSRKIVFERKVRWYGTQTYEFKESAGFAFKDISCGVHVTDAKNKRSATYVMIPYVLIDE